MLNYLVHDFFELDEDEAFSAHVCVLRIYLMKLRRLIRHDPNATNSRHAKVVIEITDSSLLATLINHF
jgi:hypothetical protein